MFQAKLYSPFPKFTRPKGGWPLTRRLGTEGRGDDAVAIAVQLPTFGVNAINDKFTQGGLAPPVGQLVFGHKMRFVTGLPEVSLRSQFSNTGIGRKIGFTLVLDTGNSNPKKVEMVTPGATVGALGSKAPM